MLNYGVLGAKEIPTPTGSSNVQFGVLLPGIKDANYSLCVNCVPESDFYNEGVAQRFQMSCDGSNPYDLWNLQISSSVLNAPQNVPSTFLYWFTLKDKNGKLVQDFIIDPFSREFGFGKFSAFTLNYQKHEWSTNETAWRTPRLQDLILYELHINEFGKDIDGCIGRLPYLQDLGVNCIEIMPVNNVIDTVDWGYLPLGHFGVDERFGNRADLQTLVDAAHQNGIAVILDAVFGHTALEFTYFDLYYQKNGNSYSNRLWIDSPFITPAIKHS